MEIINPGNTGDFHIHSSTFSDGFNTIDEIVIAAGELGYSEIAFADHSQAMSDVYGMTRKTHYDILSSGRWENSYNNVKVTFGVEADLLNDSGDICDNIQGITPKFILLSAHCKVFSSELKQIKTAFLNAISRYGMSINVLGHLCTKQFAQFLNGDDIIQIVEAANDGGIALELNCANLAYGKTDLDNLKVLLNHAQYLYVNSDAHTMNEFINLRNRGFRILERDSIR